MELVENKVTKNKRIYALVTLIIMVLNLFSPYGVIINKVYAATPAAGEPYFKISLLQPGNPDEDDDDATYYYYFDYINGSVDTAEEKQARAVVLELSIEGCNTANSGDIYFKWNKDKIVPGQATKPKRNGTPYLEEATDYTNDAKFADADFGTTEWTSPVNEILDSSEGTLRFTGGAEKDSYVSSGTVVGKFIFLLKDGVTINDITTDDIQLVPGASGLTSGLQIVYFPDGKTNKNVTGIDYLVKEGFSAGEKQISEITIDTMPTKTQYYIGESLDYTDGKLKVKYDDSSEETISISEAITKGIITPNQAVATNSKKVTFTYITKTLDLEYYVLDSISSTKNLNKMSYEHGDTIAFAGGEITATYKNSSGASTTKILNIADEIAAGRLSVDKTKADVDNKTITFTYYDGKTATMTLTVTDQIESIVVTKQPTTLTYNDGDTINLAGGEITPHTKSGKTLTPIATDAATVTASTTAASIASATNKWTIAGGEGLEAGNQTITLTYEGKTADITIVVNDTVSGVSITTQPTAKNKYGTTASGLDFTGFVATITTSGGGNFTVGANSLSIDTSSYNPNSLSVQSLPVKYGTVASSNNAEITLTNYITGITATFTQTEFEYATPLATVVSAGTYVENYADGTISTPKAITSDMVTGYVASPATALLTNHKYDETLTIKLSTSSNPFDIIPATATQQITIIDEPESINIQSKPNKIVYKYAEEFSSNGGQIKVNYKSGDSQIVSMGASSVALTQTDGSTINMSPAVSELVDGKATKTIKVTYTNEGKTFDTSFDITIKDEIDSIAITTPAKTIYEHGDTLDTSTGKITLTYKSGNTQEASLDDATITEMDGTNVEMSPDIAKYSNNELTKSLKVEYAGAQTNYDITIKNTVNSISVTAPTKVNYNLNDATELAGGKVVVTRKAGNTEDVLLTDTKVTVTDFDTTTAGVNKVANVKYTEEGQDYTGTFNYNVKDNVTGIVITVPTDVTFNHGDALTFTGGDIEVSYAGGSKAHPSFSEATIIDTATGTSVNMSPASTEYDSNNEKQVTVKITYSEDGVTKDATYTITIKNNVTKISMGTIPTKTKYNLNDTTYDLTNTAGTNGYGDIVVTRAAGNAETIALNDAKVTLIALNTLTTTAGTKTVTVTYEGKNTSFEITVENGITNAEITVPSKTTYEHGDTLDLAGGKIELTYADGTTKDVNLSTIMVSEDGGTVNMSPDSSKYVNNEITKTLTIEYTPAGWTSAVTKTYSITIKNTVDSISVTAPTKVNYNLNDATELAEGKVVVTRKAGNTEDVLLTDTKVTVTDFDTTTAGVNKVANVKYTEEGQDYTGTFNYDVKDNVTGIVITVPTDVTFNHGDALTFTGGDIEVSYAGGSKAHPSFNEATIIDTTTGTSVNMSPASTEYDSNNEKQVTVKITYSEDGVTKDATYTITIKNNVTKISMGTIPTKTKYNLNDTTYDLTNTAGKNGYGDIVVTRAAGNAETIALNDAKVTLTELNTLTTTAGTKTVTVTYEGNNTSFEITVENGITKAEITVPSKTTYEHGDTLDLTGGKIELTYADGNTTNVNLSTVMVTEDGGIVNMSPDSSKYVNNEITKTLTIEYTPVGWTSAVTKTYDITIKNTIEKIEVTAPTKVSYNLNDATELTGGKVVVTRKAGNTEDVLLTDTKVTVTDFDTNAAGVNKVANVKYTEDGKDYTGTFNYNVKDNVTGIVITVPKDVTFNHGDALTFAGGSIVVSYAGGSTNTLPIDLKKVIDKNTGIAVDMSPAAGDYTNYKLTKTLTITYTEDGKTETKDYTITIKNNVTGIAMKTNPTKATYNLNDTALDLTGASIEVTRAVGDAQIISLPNSDVTTSGFDTSSVGTKTITVTYEGQNASFDITVVNGVKDITITAPTDVNFEHGDTLTLNGGAIEVEYADGTKLPVTMTTLMIKETTTGTTVNMTPAASDYDSNNQLTKSLTIEYTEDGVTKTQDYTITITNPVDSIAIAISPKTSYKLNETTTGVGGTIKVTRKAGNTDTINIEDSMVTNLDTSLEAAGKTATVTYEGKTTTYTYDVTDNVDSIAIVGTPKTEYKLNEELETLQILVTKESGATETITVTSDMISGYDKTVEGTQTVKITYKGKDTSYSVNVKDAIKSIAMGTTPKTNYLLGDTLEVTGGTIIVTKESGKTQTINITPDMVSGFDSSSEVTGQVLTVTYEGKEATYTVNITDSISNITLNPGPTKTIYKYGESLDLTGVYIDIVKANGDTDRKQVTSSMVSGFNSKPAQGTLPSTQTITVTYGKDTSGNDVTTTFTITVEDYVEKITVNGAKTDYKYNEELDLSIGTLEITMASGTPATPIKLNNSNVTVEGYSKTTLNAQTLTVKYEGKETTYNVNVEDYITNTSIIVPTKTQYYYDDTLDLSTGKIVQTWASGKADTELSLDLTMVKEADGSEVNMKPSSFDSTNKVQKTLTITNDGKTENYTIEIINDIKSISIKEAPKTDYKYGASIDKTVGSIEVTRANGTKEEIKLTDSRITIDGFDTSAPVNNVPVTIKFTENGVTKNTTYTINVNDDITSIQLVGTPKTNYKYGESLDLTGLTLTVVRPSGTTPLVPITSNMVSGYNPNKLGSQTVTITYGGKTETFTVNVEDYLKDIELEKPTKVNYKKGESLDLTGASITEIYASGAKKTGITVTSSMVSTLDTSTIGNKTLTVTYTKEGKNFTKEFVVIVADELSTITVKTFPIDEYLYGEELDLTGATLEVEKESGDKQILPITKDMVSGYITKPASSKFEQSDEYIQVITITYTKGGVTKTTSYPITTKDYLNKIKVEGLEKDYTYGEDLKLDNATVAKVSASGVISDKVQLTKDMISGYNSKKEGNQELTISYAGKTTTQVVKVTDNILGISINSNPTKTTYNYNTTIDLSGAKLNVIKNSGIKVIDITKDMISGYNAKKAGVQTITVTYEGFTAEFTVTVKAQVYVKPSTPVINETKPIETIPEEPKVEEPIIEAPIVEEPTKQEPVEDIPQTEEKEIDPMLIGTSIVAGLSILFLIAAILMKKNVEIYIEKDNDIKLIGKEKLQGKDNEELDLTKYVEKYPEEVLNIVFSKSISKKLDNNTVIIKTTNDKTKKITVKYNNEEFITEVKQEKLETKEKIEK